MPLPSSSLMNSLRSGLSSAICGFLGSSAAATDSIRYAYERATGVTGLPSVNIPGLLRAGFCNGARDTPTVTPTYPAGQCVCATYRFKVRVTLSTGSTGNTPEQQAFGPLGGFAVNVIPDGVYDRLFVSVGATNPNGSCNPNAQTWKLVAQIPKGSAEFTGYSLIDVIRVGGLPDNCGTPQVPSPQPVPPSGLPMPPFQITYEDNSQITVTVNVSPTFYQPTINIKGELSIPVSIETDLDLGNFNFSPRLEVNLNNGDINLITDGDNLPSPGSGSGCNSPIRPVRPLPLPVGDNGDTSELDEDTKDEDVIAGCVVRVASVSQSAKPTQIYQGSNPTIYAPNLGYVQFLIKIGNELAWTSDIPVKNRNNYIPCPVEEGARDVKGTPQPGVTWSITPVRKTLERRVS